MNQSGPSWDHGIKPPPLKLSAHSNSSNISHPSLLVPSLDYEIAELTWENGQLALHGLTPLRVANKVSAMSNTTTKYPTWAKACATGTLESVVNQATHQYPEQKSANVNEVMPWFDHQYPSMVKLKPMASAPIDALVPCDNNKIHRNDNQEHSSQFDPEISTILVGYCSTGEGSCSGSGTTVTALDVLPPGINSCKTNNVSVTESATYEGRDSLQVSLDTRERELDGGTTRFTSTYPVSTEITTSAKDYPKTTVEDHDSGCYSISQRKVGEEEWKKKGSEKSLVSTKRSKAAANYNQSERKRRDKINQKMKALQRLVPNSSKTDKASILDEIIEYVKQLQAQVQLMSRMNTSPMMMQPLAMLMIPPMGIGMGMGIMDINAIGRAAASIPPFVPLANVSWDTSGGDRLPTPASIIQPDPLSSFLWCQSQTMNVDAYNKLAALYLPFQQYSPASGSASKF